MPEPKRTAPCHAGCFCLQLTSGTHFRILLTYFPQPKHLTNYTYSLY